MCIRDSINAEYMGIANIIKRVQMDPILDYTSEDKISTTRQVLIPLSGFSSALNLTNSNEKMQDYSTAFPLLKRKYFAPSDSEPFSFGKHHDISDAATRNNCPLVYNTSPLTDCQFFSPQSSGKKKKVLENVAGTEVCFGNDFFLPSHRRHVSCRYRQKRKKRIAIVVKKKKLETYGCGAKRRVPRRFQKRATLLNDNMRKGLVEKEYQDAPIVIDAATTERMSEDTASCIPGGISSLEAKYAWDNPEEFQTVKAFVCTYPKKRTVALNKKKKWNENDQPTLLHPNIRVELFNLLAKDGLSWDMVDIPALMGGFSRMKEEGLLKNATPYSISNSDFSVSRWITEMIKHVRMMIQLAKEKKNQMHINSLSMLWERTMIPMLAALVKKQKVTRGIDSQLPVLNLIICKPNMTLKFNQRKEHKSTLRNDRKAKL
eukprot:TRINITY_DN2108_c0_g1_i1.p1 TRINITY_DN2108_c0_g1~~TRINITY_DN2108_c0_g1_i1.p1  ORF type:complete len:431 (-),score=69.74 TRINITY_DN2108_c0_g1_i1:53-1345(-)